MKWAYYVKYKVKAVLVLMAIILVMLIGNIVHRNNFNKLDNAVLSIYNDRLMPSTFIFQLTDHLYQKQLLLNKQIDEQGTPVAALHKQHDIAMARLIKDYETTHLTKSEKQQWALFKKNLEQYNLAYSDVSNGFPENNPSIITEAKHRDYFNKAVQNLNALSSIQASEGKTLSRSSRDIISDGVLMSHFEISLLFILGVFALVLVSVTDTKLLYPQNHLLN